MLRPFWKDSEFTAEERRRVYGGQVDRYRLVETPEEADLCVLPMAWNHYHRHGTVDEARAFVERGRAAGRPVATWVTGDSGVRVPDRDVFVFRQSGYASRRLPNQHALPVFVRDPLPAGLAGAGVRPRGPRPVVGFCGQAADHPLAQGVKAARTVLRNGAFALRLTPVEPETVRPPTRLRARALRLLERSEAVETRFLRRDRYRGGARTPAEAARLREEFWGNIRDTDYTVCVRGSGNFSQRLYEVLAMGRIPVFVNTDCILPAEYLVDWKRHCVWVEERDLAELADRVAEHHAGLDDAAFRDLQRTCRTVWEEHLSYSGFFTHFPTLFHAAPAAAIR